MPAGVTGAPVSRGAGCLSRQTRGRRRSSVLRAQGDFLLKAGARVRVVGAAALFG
jgi:hypothetical protein